MASAAELERKLRAQPDCFELKANESGKSNVWKQFSLIFEKDCDNLRKMKYLCACNSCRRVYAYKSDCLSIYVKALCSISTKALYITIPYCFSTSNCSTTVSVTYCIESGSGRVAGCISLLAYSRLSGHIESTTTEFASTGDLSSVK